ncbi:transcriptional regulator, LysR family [Leptothrix cholodnii SP-6]|uniref:Transcriptional regulator, LysR family n=1 Tax=Leptothrix cholodnii (strain ATCC 51168 / LMG 8142 / SP-6) TaxID=395495 RepID=B1XX32_LEPCP|nr:LysR substrate-binding domain-containing protein [Leptothrix cholodnii]ACB32678.1 transcriptional regulator, LysR family [Leptothrix cholodnii SP-6]
MAHIPPLANLQAFEAVARRRSFALAAGELNLTASAVSHQIARLESFLGVRLFDRSAQGVKLSAAGEGYLRRVAGALGAIGAATDDVRQGVRNSLYVHASPSFASLWLMPRLAHFAQAHPGISLFLSASPTHSDFALGQADLDVRYGTPQWPDLVVQPIFEEPILPLASPAFIARHRLREPAELLLTPLIQSTVSVVQWADWLTTQGVTQGPERFALRFDRAQLALDAAVQGLGVALESATIAQAHIAEGRLAPLFDTARAVRVQAHFLVYPARHAKRPEVESFNAWLKDQASAAPGAAAQVPPSA